MHQTIALLLACSLSASTLLPAKAFQEQVEPLTADDIWEPVRQVLEAGVKNAIFPGAVALVQTSEGTVFQYAVGNLTYGEDTPLGNPNTAVTPDTIFDMASCTKVLSTTTATALLFQSGAFGPDGLDTPVSKFLPGYEANGKAPVTLKNCLLHNAGLPPDPTPYDFWDPKFGCAGAPLPQNLSFACSERAYAAILNQGLRPGAVVGASYVYSDISFLTLMYVVGKVAAAKKYVSDQDFVDVCHGAPTESGQYLQCAYEAFVRKHVMNPLGAHGATFLPKRAVWSQCAPTTVPVGEPAPAHGQDLQGRVEDGNAYMLGGIAGHAGLFSPIADISRIVGMWMQFPSVQTVQLLDNATIELFVKQHNHSQSSRAFGWNTNDITAQPDGGWNASCGSLSPQTFNHVGYTGTQVCADPVRGAFTVLLTARVYHPAPTGIHSVRQEFNDAVVIALNRSSHHTSPSS